MQLVLDTSRLHLPLSVTLRPLHSRGIAAVLYPVLLRILPTFHAIMGEEDSERIRFEEPIQPVHTGLSSHPSDNKENIHPISERAFRIDDEEKARKIAEEDLNTSHKQVRA